jgi:exodeoxyribonuclease VII large subunit
MKLPLKPILSVSELTLRIKEHLELKFSEIWVEGEISNFKVPPSGHLYFTLKDDSSQIRTVMFRMQSRGLRFVPGDGLQVICRGRVSLYEKRGEYQLLLEAMEPKGIGALQLAFLQLKERLEQEGLFDPLHKKAIPMVPQKIGIITSPTGAVIRDMLHIIDRRFENVHILLYPVRVQGEGASLEMCKAIEYFNAQTEVDVIIVGRGGGSLEDLWSFNEEVIARAIYRSNIPIISAVGHETDYTISDFVADLRAPTPSAAAELVVRDKRELINTLNYLKTRLNHRIEQNFQEYRIHLFHLIKILISPKKRIENYFLRLDELTSRLTLLNSWVLKGNRETCLHFFERISLQHPHSKVETLRLTTFQTKKRLERIISHSMEIRRQHVWGIFGKLESLSPLSILQRGYSITRKIPLFQILKDSSQVQRGDKVEVRLHRGMLLCEVEKTERS